MRLLSTLLISLALLTCAGEVSAAPVLVKSCVVGNEANTASITTPSCVNTAGNFLILTTTAVRPFSTLTVSDTCNDTFLNANPSVFPFHDTGQDGDVYVWYVKSALGCSPNTFKTIPTSGNSALEIHVSEWSGMSGWLPDTNATAVAFALTGGSAFNSGSKTTTKNGELIFGYTFPLGNSTPGAGYTGITLVNGDWDEFRIQPTAGSISATFTSDNNGTWLALMQPFMSTGCHAVSPSGSGAGNGTSWSNTLAGIPAAPIRGDIYYLSDGTYPSYTFNEAGSTSIELRKAQSYDFGRSSDGCSNDISAGWVTGTMGSSQAVFNNLRMFEIESPGLIINGNGTQTTPGCGGAVGSNAALSPANPKDCGIKVDNSSCGSVSSNGCSDLISDGGVLSGGLTFKYTEILGMGNATSENYLIRADGTTGSLFRHIYAHHLGAVAIVAGGTTNLEVDSSYLWLEQVVQGSNPGHGQYIEIGGSSSGGNIHHSIWRDGSGTGTWIFLSSGTSTGWKFYDNIIWNTPGYTPPNPLANGILGCINSHICNGFVLNQNTIVGLTSTAVPGILFPPSSMTAQNNLWYSNPFGVTLPAGNDHNSFLVSGTTCPTGTANVCNNTSSNPFVNWPGGVFDLSSDAANWNNRVSLAALYNVDLAGNAFTTDRGALQFTGGVLLPIVSLSPSSLSSGNQAVFSTSNGLSVTLSNTGTASLTITSISTIGVNPSDFIITLNTCGGSLAPSSSCSVTVAFNPNAVGVRTSNLSFITNAGSSPDNIPLSGTGVAVISSQGIGAVSGAGVVKNP